MNLPSVRRLYPIAALVLSALLVACTAKTPQQTNTETPVPPAAHKGYLPPDAIPDSLALSPPPPEPGSVWARLDETIAANVLALHGSTRFEQAHADADLAFPAAAEHFSCALGIAVEQEYTPALYRLLERTGRDASASTRAAKRHYQRPRPFMLNGQPTCSPDYEDRLRGSGSYPSGHTAIGWTWALILAELAPEHTHEIIQRGRSYGHSRLVCNVHWYSDVVQGQALAAATVASLHHNAEFVADLTSAREELIQARTRALPLARDCTTETAVLATPIPGVR